MKPKITPESLEEIKFADYRKLLYKELKRMKNTKEPVQFIMMTEYVFADFPSKKLPFLVVGSLNTPWTNYYKNVAKKRKNKDFSFGKCNFGAALDGGIFEFRLEINSGKINERGKTALEKTLLKKVKLKPVIAVNLKEEEAVATNENEVTNVAKVATATAGSKDQKEKKTTISEEKKTELLEQAAAFKEQYLNLRSEYHQVQKEVSKNLKAGKSGRRDLLIIERVQKAYASFCKVCEEADKAVQKKLRIYKKKIEEFNKGVIVLALAVKDRKKSLAHQFADEFYLKNHNRIAEDAEASKMQLKLKKAMAYRKIKDLKGQEKALSLKSIFLAARHKGPEFKLKHTDVIYAHLAKVS